MASKNIFLLPLHAQSPKSLFLKFLFHRAGYAVRDLTGIMPDPLSYLDNLHLVVPGTVITAGIPGDYHSFIVKSVTDGVVALHDPMIIGEVPTFPLGAETFASTTYNGNAIKINNIVLFK